MKHTKLFLALALALALICTAFANAQEIEFQKSRMISGVSKYSCPEFRHCVIYVKSPKGFLGNDDSDRVFMEVSQGIYSIGQHHGLDGTSVVSELSIDKRSIIISVDRKHSNNVITIEGLKEYYTVVDSVSKKPRYEARIVDDKLIINFVLD